MVQNDFVTDLFKRTVEKLIGEETIIVAEYLIQHDGEECVDEDIAEETDLNIKIVRNSLFKLNENSLARFRRERNSETGYFIYYWHLTQDKVFDLLFRKNQRITKIIKQRIEYEERNLLYSCGNPDCSPLDLEKAYTQNFTCPKCGGFLDQQENESIVSYLGQLLEAMKAIQKYSDLKPS